MMITDQRHGREQKLIDIMFQIAILSAKHMSEKSNEEIANWVADQLRECGYPTTPMGMSWGVLKEWDTDCRATLRGI